MAERIDSFSGQYAFLSNFFVEKNGRSNEHYFQAAKATNLDDCVYVLEAATPSEAKRRGRRIPLRTGWDQGRRRVMDKLLRRKFTDPALRRALLETGDRLLVEGNTWCDTFWGVCNCPRHSGRGENQLGQALMVLRTLETR